MMFDSGTQHTDSTFDPLGPITDSYKATDSCSPREKISNLNDDVIQFRPNKKNGDESGVCSPPLWSKTPPRNPVHPHESHKKIKNSPPSLRVQAITRGQVELMEMVKAMPESLYELSLKDLVDHQKLGNQVSDQENTSFVRKKASGITKQGSIRKQASAKKIVRTGSNINTDNNNNNDKGLFLKMGFPMQFGGSKKKAAKSKEKKAKTKENPYAKASTKVVDDKSNVNDQKEWWKRRYSVVSDDSESGGLSSNGSSGSSGSNDSSGSSNSNQSCCRNKSGLLRGCSPFHSIKNKTVD